MDFTIQTLEHLKPLIKSFRKRANLTQSAMAEKLGISQQSYAQIESNLASTSVERLFTILRLMHVNIQLTDGNPDTAPAFQITTRARKNRAAHQAAHVTGPAVPETSIARKTPPRGQYSGRTDPAYPPQRSQAGSTVAPSGKAALGSAPAKVIKRNDTTKW